MIEVRNRKLEQFYFLHGINYTRFRKDPLDGMTIWEYEDNEENRRILEEFRVAVRRREEQKEQKYHERNF